ncbi:hypothetical protein CT0861_04243 [Colletotrichum tofieldiae]|uniref:Uncharacterized protein n=1 Tax=Colletotrichum tofieldiae TaxID=708197 RepID=A0A161Y5A6_9PEZI|nr:hypothetical protein CT0861_04243 [Colletotrichum tofieldiae]
MNSIATVLMVSICSKGLFHRDEYTQRLAIGRKGLGHGPTNELDAQEHWVNIKSIAAVSFCDAQASRERPSSGRGSRPTHTVAIGGRATAPQALEIPRHLVAVHRLVRDDLTA